ncbi:MAG TPA: DNA repair protein RecN [Polyangiales bacterium]|nr:DNA repair protein RecN [Polyangiales bacterium]
MLLCLRVKNLAIIDELEVEFPAGMNVVTGETGAGKSILVDALGLVLGAKGSPSLVRTGETEAEVEALFDVTDHAAVREAAAAMGVDAGDELVLRRVVQASDIPAKQSSTLRGGRTRAYVNGRLVTVAQLAELARGLCDISSQHEHHTLVDAASHMQFLDAFAELDPQRTQMASAYETLANAHQALTALQERSGKRDEREDLLRYQIGEIEALDPQPAEHTTLAAERDRLRHAERLTQLTGGAEDALYARDQALCTELSRVLRSVEEASALDPRLSRVAEQLGSAHRELEDAARELGSYARSVVHDTARLVEVEERLDALSRVARKYGGSIEAALVHKERAKQELAELEHGQEREAELRAQLTAAETRAREAAEKLSQGRRTAAKKLGRAVSKELGSLAMGDASITVEVEPARGKAGELSIDGARLSSTGVDRVEFLIAPNPGEAPQPLSKIASGGELSRAMLGLKRVLAGLGPGGLYVFDEVDAGVGGAVAEVIGRKIREVSQHHQVICITHLPQIAVYADTHYRVQKSIAKGRTRSEIVRLAAEEQREEIARMLGGIEITRETRAAAREMLKSARR